MKIMYAEYMNDDYGALFTVVEYPKNTSISTKHSVSKNLYTTLSQEIWQWYFGVVRPTDPAIKSLMYETQSNEDTIDYIY